MFHLTAAERKTLLVAGAAGGMAATFGTPMAAVLLAVELLLFEWKPRSLIPVALASAVAALLRPYLLGAGPLFPVAPHDRCRRPALLSSAASSGCWRACSRSLLTLAVYAAEDAVPPLADPLDVVAGARRAGRRRRRLLIQPRALGVGYDIIDDLLSGHYVLLAHRRR